MATFAVIVQVVETWRCITEAPTAEHALRGCGVDALRQRAELIEAHAVSFEVQSIDADGRVVECCLVVSPDEHVPVATDASAPHRSG